MSKIAFFTNSIFTVGGEQRVVSLIANKLSERHDITIFTMDSPKTKKTGFSLAECIKVNYFRPYRFDLISFIYRALTHLTPALVYDWFPSMIERAYCATQYADLMNSLVDDTYDFVIVTSWQLSIILGKVKNKYNRRFRAIAWQHNSYDAYFETKYLYLYKHEKLFSNNLKSVDNIVVLNDEYRQEFKLKMNLDCHTIYNPKTFYSEEKCKLMKQKMLVCSRLDVFQKGLDLLYQSLCSFMNNSSDWEIIIAGDGKERSKYEKLIKASSFSDRVTFLGRINDVKSLMLESSLLLLPSRFEGFPMSVTEAFEVGLPVLAYDIPAMRVFEEAGGAITVPGFDTYLYSKEMDRLATDYRLRSELGKKAIDFAKLLSMEHIISEWEKILVAE